jgi:hypothetical protein
MRVASPRIYKSFQDFERDELRKLDSLSGSIDDMLDEMFAEELDFEGGAKRARRTDEDE